MSINKSRFEYLLKQYLQKSASPEEFKELFGYINDEAYKEIFFDLMKEEGQNLALGADVHTIDWDTMYKQIVARPKPVQRKLYRLLPIAVAASLICVMGLVIYLNTTKVSVTPIVAQKTVQMDIAPGSDKAVLELADGRKIDLDDSQTGVLTEQGNVQVNKIETGLLAYQKHAGAAPAEAVYHTLRTPRGGKYMLILPDGSKVWLNSASSLTYPTQFSGKTREVQMTGEVYFEIAKNTKQPFRVQTGKANVEVLGTHFNIMSYDDEEAEEVTLLEGSIRLNHGEANELLLPGQLASYTATSATISIRRLDFPEARVDWKNGLFQFENESLVNIMRKVSRWYDRDIVYEGEPGPKHFTGTLPRNNNVSKLLNLLKTSGDLKFEINDKTITVKE